MIYGSVCSGIEAATVAWHPLGWIPAFFSEIDSWPCKVLAHHYPTTPNYGDMTNFKEWPYEKLDILVGGTPCQSFSVAGLRKGLDDPRGNLMLTFLAIAKRYSPQWVVWENVPGVLSSHKGLDFDTFLKGLAELGYGFAYRVLDAQHFGVPQRRRRVFVIGCLGDWRSSAAVLFEQHSLQGHTAPHREKGQEVTEIAGTLAANGGGLNRPAGNANELDFCIAVGSGEISKTLMAGHNKQDPEVESYAITYALAGNTIGRQPENGGNGNGYDDSGVSYTLTKTDVHAVCYPINTQIATRHEAMGEGTGMGIADDGAVAYTLQAAHSHAVAHAFKVRGGCEGGGKGYLGQDEKAFTVSTGQDQQLFHKMQVRRLLPIECERLQGFPENFTNIPGASDSARYKALGNSMAVPVMSWIGKRIEMIENMRTKLN